MFAELTVFMLRKCARGLLTAGNARMGGLLAREKRKLIMVLSHRCFVDCLDAAGDCFYAFAVRKIQPKRPAGVHHAMRVEVALERADDAVFGCSE